MSHSIVHRLACISTLALATAASAAPVPLVVIEDPSSAARAIMTTESVAGNALRPLDAMTVDARLLVQQTLGWFSAATTTTAVIAARQGVSVPCPQGGQVWAFVPKPVTGTVRLRWTGCAYQNGSQPTRVDGAGEIKVPAETFTPDYLLALHFGTAGSDVVSSSTYSEDPGTAERHMNVHVIGRLPLTRFRNVGIFTGPYDVTINGKVDSHYMSPGNDESAAYDSWYYQHAENVRLIGSTTHAEADTVLDEQVTFRSGTFRQIGVGAGTDIPESAWPSMTGQDLRVRRVLRALDGIATATMQGRVHETRNPFNPGCDEGWFSFKTLVPVRIYDAFGTGGEDAGHVIVNGARITFKLTDGPAGPSYYTPRPNERPTQVTVNMANGSTFEFKSYLVSATASEYVVCPAN